MFATLKNKIITETGQDPVTELIRNRTRHCVTTSHNSLSIDELSSVTEEDNKVQNLKLQLVRSRLLFENLETEKKSLEEKIRIIQVQNEIFSDENELIQNSQHSEIIKMKSMLLFREQESIDHMNKLKNDQHTIEQLKNEVSRMKSIELKYEHVQDELENLHRSSQMERNQFKTQLSATEEKIRHLSSKLELEQSRALFASLDSENDKVKLLLHEKRILENQLEEAHLHLLDIKSSWTSQNLTLENQIDRLSRQVAEETAEKRKAVEAEQSLCDKVRQLESDLIKARDELKQRDNKIKLMSEEVEELLHGIHLDNGEEIECFKKQSCE